MNTLNDRNTGMTSTTKEFVQKVITPKAGEIIQNADRSGCHGLDLANEFTAVPVHYMQGDPDSLWELGFVPKKVDFDGMRFTSNEVFLYRWDTDVIRGPNDCVFSNGQWERCPD